MMQTVDRALRSHPAAVGRGQHLLSIVAIAGLAGLMWLVPWQVLKDHVAPIARTPIGATAALVLGLAALIALCAALVRGQLAWLVIGEDNRYSNSKFQMAVWFLTVLGVYLGAVLLRSAVLGLGSIGHVAVPTTVLTLSGISALTFGGAKKIVTTRIRRAGGATRLVKPPSRRGPNLLADLVNDDSGHRPDLGDVQMLVITLIAVAVYLVQGWDWLSTKALLDAPTLPDIDGTLLGAFGLGQGAYLVKKVAGDNTDSAPGPVLNSTPPRPNHDPNP
jgi:hypothetical protein